MKQRIAIVAVIVPVIMMVTWLGSLVLDVYRAKEVVLQIEGYDPRSLLYGHYLQYNVRYGITAPEPKTVSDWRKRVACMCLSDSTPSKGTWLGRCADRDKQQCPLYIVGWQFGDQFMGGIERYYIPEEYQKALATIPNNSTITVRVTPSGGATVVGMHVAGEPILEYAKRL